MLLHQKSSGALEGRDREQPGPAMPDALSPSDEPIIAERHKKAPGNRLKPPEAVLKEFSHTPRQNTKITRAYQMMPITTATTWSATLEPAAGSA